MRSKARATSGRIGLPCLYASGPEYPPPVARPAIPVPPSTASSAVARALTATKRLRPLPRRTPARSLTLTVTRVGAKRLPGKVTTTRAESMPLRRAPRSAAVRANPR